MVGTTLHIITKNCLKIFEKPGIGTTDGTAVLEIVNNVVTGGVTTFSSISGTFGDGTIVTSSGSSTTYGTVFGLSTPEKSGVSTHLTHSTTGSLLSPTTTPTSPGTKGPAKTSLVL